MWHDAYLESKVLSADPLELVNLLYQEAIRCVRDGRAHLAAGRIAERSAAVSKAQAVLSELATSLNMQTGGELSRNLARLYAYMSERLAEANFRQVDGPMAEVLGLLATLAEAFDGIRNGTAVEVRQAVPVAQPERHMANSLAGQFFREPAVSGAQGWSL